MKISKFIKSVKRVCRFTRRRKVQEDPIELQAAEPDLPLDLDVGDLAVMELSDQWNDHPPIFHDERGNIRVYMEIIVVL